MLEKIKRIMELAYLINPTETKQSVTGNKPTIFVNFSGHCSLLKQKFTQTVMKMTQAMMLIIGLYWTTRKAQKSQTNVSNTSKPYMKSGVKMQNDGFDLAQSQHEKDQPEPDIIGYCVFCERDIYKCEIEDTILIDGLLAHIKCLPDDEECTEEEF